MVQGWVGWMDFQPLHPHGLPWQRILWRLHKMIGNWAEAYKLEILISSAHSFCFGICFISFHICKIYTSCFQGWYRWRELLSRSIFEKMSLTSKAEAVSEWQYSYLLGSLGSGDGIWLLWCYMGNIWPSSGHVGVPWGTGLWQRWTRWSHSGLLAGMRVRPSTMRTKWFVLFSSCHGKCSLLDAPQQVEQKGNISLWGKTVRVLLIAGIRLVAIRDIDAPG